MHALTHYIITELIKYLKETEINFFHNCSAMQYCYFKKSSKKENLHGSQYLMKHYIQLNMK